MSLQIPVFITLTVAYHVKLDDANPLKWKFDPSEDMSGALEVENPDKRRGRLELEDWKRNPFTRSNAERILEFVWTWVQ